ncbi:MAG: hypothetical protein EPN84_02365 [Legionella sp.]|nr:MAG: hypothetical protein EPN84_02365 [Legionella sp.]
MITLVLDLDHTVFLALSEYMFSAMGHHTYSADLYELTMTWEEHFCQEHVSIINPIKLKKLLETAGKLGVRLMFYTTGCWDEQPVKSMLSSALPLSPQTIEMIRTAVFLASNNSPQYDEKLSWAEIAKIPKGEGLLTFEKHTNTQEMKYVFVDDSTQQLQSLKNNTRVTTIHASTKLEAKMDNERDYTLFYDAAIEALERLCAEEQKAQEEADMNELAEITQGLAPAAPANVSAASNPPLRNESRLSENRNGWFPLPEEPANLADVASTQYPVV